MSQSKYITRPAIANVTANVLNLADAANDDVAAVDADVDGVAMVVLMIRTPGHC